MRKCYKCDSKFLFDSRFFDHIKKCTAECSSSKLVDCELNLQGCLKKCPDPKYIDRDFYLNLYDQHSVCWKCKCIKYTKINIVGNLVDWKIDFPGVFNSVARTYWKNCRNNCLQEWPLIYGTVLS